MPNGHQELGFDRAFQQGISDPLTSPFAFLQRGLAEDGLFSGRPDVADPNIFTRLGGLRVLSGPGAFFSEVLSGLTGRDLLDRKSVV